MSEKKQKQSTFLRVLKKVKISHLIILALLLIGNTYAWFIYVDTVSNSIDVHIKAWNIDLQDDQGTVTDTVNVFVDAVYPGMPTFEKEINMTNYSDLNATVSYEILYVDIMGERTYSSEGKDEYNIGHSHEELSSAELIDQLENDYPFVFGFFLDNPHLGINSTATYVVSLSWDYESGNDTLDTQWGKDAYAFKEANPDLPCISLNIKIKIQQDS